MPKNKANSILNFKQVDTTSKKKKGKTKQKSTNTKSNVSKKLEINQYIHYGQKRMYNPPIGLVSPKTDKELPMKKYSFDPHYDPQLTWSGKKENSNFEIDTISLHIHEKIDPITILEKIMKKSTVNQLSMSSFFDSEENTLPIKQEMEFYKHNQISSNRMIAGDSLLIMNSLLHKENFNGKIQMIYIDPPYGITYGSNFQPFVNKRKVTDGKDEDLTDEPETIKAFRDTWELGIHSYLSYLSERILLCKQLLTESGSIFIQISDENVHHIREIMDEIFGVENFITEIIIQKTGGLSQRFLPRTYDILVWYAKNKKETFSRKLFLPRSVDPEDYQYLELEDGSRRSISKDEKSGKKSVPENAKLFSTTSLESDNPVFDFTYDGKTYSQSWKTNAEGLKRLAKANRISNLGKTLRYIRYYDDFPVRELTNVWDDTMGERDMWYVVQTNKKIIGRCILMTTKPGDIVFDPTCGSGTTAYAAEQWGRRWITCDTSRVALNLAKQRLLTSTYDYSILDHPDEGISGGFKYKTVPHIKLKSIAQNEPFEEEKLFDQPLIESSMKRITGPFTVEAVSAREVRNFDDDEVKSNNVSVSANYNLTKQYELWRDELLRTGVIGKNNQKIEFSRIDFRKDTKWIHAEAETKEQKPKRVLIAFGDRYSPMKRKQVHNALFEAQNIIPPPDMVLFMAFQFDPMAKKVITDTNWSGITLLPVYMNLDLETKDLKKKSYTNQSFWLLGQPEIELKKLNGKYVVDVLGFDFFDINTDGIVSGDTSKIAMWMLDTDYDDRTFYPKQIFFTNSRDGWEKLSHTLKASIDESLLKKFHGTTSLPFEKGDYEQIAVKIIDSRGIESLVTKQLA